MNKKQSNKTRAVITSDKYISESGLQGGKVLGNHLSLFSFIIGIPLLIIGVISLIGIFFDFGFQSNTAIIIGAVLITIIGSLLTFGGYLLVSSK